MYSYRQFTPGNKSNSSRMINYAALYSAQGKEETCFCVPEKYDKFIRQSNSCNISNNQRIAQKIKSSLGGSTQFGNSYLGEPTVINYLGRTAGQPGGGGSPPKNKF
jgi:hypothetical protein